MKNYEQAIARLRSGGVLEPIDRISELLFGLIMALTFTCTLGVATADALETRTMVLGALGCNLAWGLIDGGIYLLTMINHQGRGLLSLRALRAAPDAAAADHVLADALPPRIVAVMTPDLLAQIRQKLLASADAGESPRLRRDDWLGAAGVLLITFASTFPVVIPFIAIGDVHLALRISNAVAIVMMFACGYAFGHRAGLRPVVMGGVMVLIGCALVGVAIALGG